MAISRAQIPEQIDIFQNGGDVTSTDPLDLLKQLANKRLEESADYDKTLSKYQDRLTPYTYQAPPMSIYDLASDLGAGLLATPNTGGASAYVGLGVGFNRASERMKAQREENRKAKQQMALQAATLAMQDEQKALDFINEINLKMIEIANEPGESILLQGPTSEITNKLLSKETKIGETGVVELRDNAKNRSLIDSLRDEGWTTAKTPGSVVNIDQTEETVSDKEAAKAQTERQKKIIEEAGAADATLQQVDYALTLANQITNDGQNPEKFGAVPNFLVPIKNVGLGLGFDFLFDTSTLDEEIAIGQVNLGFVMRLVGQTKGAISNREMEMFQQAAPTLGATYGGYVEMLNYLAIIANKQELFAEEYISEKQRYENEIIDSGKKVTASKMRDHMDLWEVKWKKQNSIFDAYAQVHGGTAEEARNRIYNAASPENAQLRKSAIEGQDSLDTADSSNPFNPQGAIVNDLIKQRNEVSRKLKAGEYSEDEIAGAQALIQQLNEQILRRGGQV